MTRLHPEDAPSLTDFLFDAATGWVHTWDVVAGPRLRQTFFVKTKTGNLLSVHVTDHDIPSDEGQTEADHG